MWRGEDPKDWEGVELDGDRVVKLDFDGVDFGWTDELTNVPAEIGQLTSLKVLHLSGNKLTRVPAAIRELRAGGCRVDLDYSVTVDDL